MSRKALPAAFEVEVPLDPRDPIIVEEHARVLAFAVVTRESQARLTSEWDAPGVYVLLGRIGQGEAADGPIGPDEWCAYVGQATSLRNRLRDHNRGKQFWAMAVLVRRYGGRALNRAHIAWLEHALHQRLNDLPGVHLENSNTPPTDTGLSLSDERMTEEIAESTLQALALIGYRGSTQSGALRDDFRGEKQAGEALATRETWASRAGEEHVALAERLLLEANDLAGLTGEVGYKTPYLAVDRNGKGDLRMLVRPQRTGVLCEYKIPRTAELDAVLAGSGLEVLPYVDRWSQYRVRVTPETVAAAAPLLRDLAIRALGAAPKAHPSKGEAAAPKRRIGPTTISVLLASGCIPAGSRFTVLPDVEYPADTRVAVKAWLDADPNRQIAEWNPQGNEGRPFKWLVDGQQYTPTGLANHFLKEATGSGAPLQGPLMWADESGRTLVQLANAEIRSNT